MSSGIVIFQTFSQPEVQLTSESQAGEVCTVIYISKVLKWSVKERVVIDL